MKRVFAAAVMTATLTGLSLAGCSQAPAPQPEAAAADAAAVEASASIGDPLPAPAATAPGEVRAAAEGAPAFAVIYPGGVPEGPAVMAQGPTGPGGILTYTTDAAPEAVVDFYKARAEAAGLKAITSLNQGGARGYSAGDGADGRGELLSVVATPVDGATSVQLDWTAGR